MASDGNMKSATQTYEGFVDLIKCGTIACALVGALVILLIAR